MTGSLRAKVKRAFTRQGARGSDSSQEKKSKKSTDEWPDNVYKPGEPMPKPKYRAPVNRQHQAKLSAFSFADAWNRRSSEQSQYSPRGSRLPSAVNSLRRKSLRPGLRSRRASAADGRLDENVDRDDDVGNVGLSSAPNPGSISSIHPPPPTATSTTALQDQNQKHSYDSAAGSDNNNNNNGNSNSRTMEMDMPFTEAELALALTKSGIRH